MIEIVAYILLAHVSKTDFAINESAASKLVHWLSKQRNALGGFASTQVTIWGKLWGKKRDTVHRVIRVCHVCACLSRSILCREAYMSPAWEGECCGEGFCLFVCFFMGSPRTRTASPRTEKPCSPHTEVIQKPVNSLAYTLVVSEHDSGPLDVYFSLLCLI